MAILGSLNRKNNLPMIFCQVRKKNLPALPEECVRVQLLAHLVNVLGYPPGGIAIERELASMPHLQGVSHPLPLRRADIVCFTKREGGDESLFPLLLIECKSVKLTRKMEHQVVGYNHFLQAAFVALVNQNEARTGWFDREKGEYQFISSLPSYAELLANLRRS
jgi:hypothetical protein